EPPRRQRPHRGRRVGGGAAQRVARLRAQRGRRLRGALRPPAAPGRQAGRHGRLQRHPGGGGGPVRRSGLRPDAPEKRGNPNPRAKITRMTPPDDDRPERDLYDETPRSIFAATWFRALLVLIVLAVVGAVAVPYILDAMNPPVKSVASRPTPPPTPAPPAATPTPSPPPGAMSAPADKAPDKTLLPDRALADKPTTTMPTARSPFGVDKAPTDKPAMSPKPGPSDKPPASTKPAPTEKSATAEKKDTRMAAAAPETRPKPEAKAAPTTTKRAATSSTSTAKAPRRVATGERRGRGAAEGPGCGGAHGPGGPGRRGRARAGGAAGRAAAARRERRGDVLPRAGGGVPGPRDGDDHAEGARDQGLQAVHRAGRAVAVSTRR